MHARHLLRCFTLMFVACGSAAAQTQTPPPLPRPAPTATLPPAPAAVPPASSPASSPSPASPQASTAAAPSTLDARIEDAKSTVLRLNRDLRVLEEELLFPANSHVAVFVSMDVGKTFALDSVRLRLNNIDVGSYLYTPSEVQALHRGGVQRLYVGNVRTGKHEIVAFFTGKGPGNRDYTRGATVRFDKAAEAKVIELVIRDATGNMQPEFFVKVWQ